MAKYHGEFFGEEYEPFSDALDTIEAVANKGKGTLGYYNYGMAFGIYEELEWNEYECVERKLVAIQSPTGHLFLIPEEVNHE